VTRRWRADEFPGNFGTARFIALGAICADTTGYQGEFRQVTWSGALCGERLIRLVPNGSEANEQSLSSRIRRGNTCY
jgi:hypothetical protein